MIKLFIRRQSRPIQHNQSFLFQYSIVSNGFSSSLIPKKVGKYFKYSTSVFFMVLLLLLVIQCITRLPLFDDTSIIFFLWQTLFLTYISSSFNDKYWRPKSYKLGQRQMLINRFSNGHETAYTHSGTFMFFLSLSKCRKREVVSLNELFMLSSH